MKNRKYDKVGKIIATKQKALGRASKDDGPKASVELKKARSLKAPGTMLFIDDGHFFEKPHRGGHLYLVDEYSGEKVAVNRLSHSKGDHNKASLASMPRSEDGTPTFAQLDVIYTGKKGKPIKLKETKLPGKTVTRPSESDLEMVSALAYRDSVQREKWRKK
ncbi:MAG: hypothetical protein WC509_02145 [Candidatus Izemoplasmatales bacterium]